MGRLTKRKIDNILAMWDEGYTQKEIAAKAGCAEATVRKYIRREGGGVATSIDERVKRIEEHVNDLDFLLLLGNPQLPCPFCRGTFCYREREEGGRQIQELACDTGDDMCKDMGVRMFELTGQ